MHEIAVAAGAETQGLPAPERRYISGGADGWLNVKREPSGVVIALPEYLRVEWENTVDGRDHFMVTEGVESGKRFSVKAGNLKAGNPGHRGSANLIFTIGDMMLEYPGGRVRAITHVRSPVPLGPHPIQIPDFPHHLGAQYTAQSSYAKSWFFLGQGRALPGSNDRYLHPGLVSQGCITVDASQWTSLYRYLIFCRSGNGKTVGNVTVAR